MTKHEEKALLLMEQFYALTATDNRSYPFNDAMVRHQHIAPLKAVVRARDVSALCVQHIINAFDDCSCEPILEGTFGIEDWKKVLQILTPE